MALKPVGARLVLDNQSGFLSGFAKANRAVDVFGNSVDGAGIKSVALGNILANVVTGGLTLVARGMGKVASAGANFLGDSVTMAADLQFQMSGVQAVLGATNEEMDILDRLTKGLGLDPNLKVSSLEAGAAIEVLARNGLDVTQIMGGAARAVIAMGNATGGDFVDAADIATDVLGQFGIGVDGMGQVIDGVTGVVNNSKFTLNDYALAIAQAGKISAETGISLADTNTIIAATASSFKSGSDSGTSYKTMLQRLSNPTNKQAALMEELGLSLFDASGNTIAMADFVGDLNSAFAGMTDQQKANTAAMLGGADASRTILALASLNKEEFQALSAEVNAQGQAFTSAQTRMNNFKGIMEILDGVVETVKLGIGEGFLPVLSELGGIVTEFISKNAQPFIDFFQQAGEATLTFVNALMAGQSPLAAFSGLLLGLGVSEGVVTSLQNFVSSVQNIISTVSTFVSEHADAFKGALVGIGAVLAGAGIIAGLSAVVGLIGAILSPIGLLVIAAAGLGIAWNTNWLGIQEKTATVVAFIQERMDALAGFWDQHGASILATSQEIWGAVLDFVTGIWDSLVLSFNAFSQLFQGNFSAFGELLALAWTSNWNNMAQFLGNMWSIIQPHLANLFTSISGWFNSQDWEQHGLTVIEAIGEALAGFWGVVQPILEGWWTSIQSWFASVDWKQLGIDVIDFIEDGLAGFWALVQPVLEGWWTSISSWWTGIDWKQLGVDAIGFIKDGLALFWSLVSSILEGWWTSIQSWWNGIDWFQLGFDATTLIIMGLAAIFIFVTETLPAWWEDIKGWWTGIDWQGLGITAIEKIVTGLANISDLVEQFGTMAEDGAKTFAEFDWAAAGRAVIDGIAGAIRNGAAEIAGILREIAAGAIAAFKDALGASSPSQVFEDIGKDIIDGLVIGIRAGAGAVQGALDGLLGQTTIFSPFGSAAFDVSDPLIQSRIAAKEFHSERIKFLQQQQRLFAQAIELGTDLTGIRMDEHSSALDILELQVRVGRDLEQTELERLGIAQAQARLNVEQGRLNFLENQQKLLADIAEAGLDPAAILGGFQVGLEADQGDFLDAMTRFIQAMIRQTEDELGIASPSKIFASFGRDITAGLAKGIMATMQLPGRAVQAMTQAVIRPPASSSTIINNSQQSNTFNMTVNDQVDAGMLQLMIQRSLGATIA